MIIRGESKVHVQIVPSIGQQYLHCSEFCCARQWTRSEQQYSWSLWVVTMEFSDCQGVRRNGHPVDRIVSIDEGFRKTQYPENLLSNEEIQCFSVFVVLSDF